MNITQMSYNSNEISQWVQKQLALKQLMKLIQYYYHHCNIYDILRITVQISIICKPYHYALQKKSKSIDER